MPFLAPIGLALGASAGTATATGAIALGSMAAPVVSSAIQARSANKAGQQQADAANRAAEIQAQSNREALAFARQQEEARAREWAAAQAQNLGIYQEDQRYQRSRDAIGDARFDQQRGDLAPYRQMGVGSLGQLLQPIRQRPQPQGGTLRDLMRG